MFSNFSIVITSSLLFAACSPPGNKFEPSNGNRELVPNPEALTHDTYVPAQTVDYSEKKDKPDYIIFGMYAGECGGHCATMYQYFMKGNMSILLADYTDSFFKNDHSIVCQTKVNDQKKKELAKEIASFIPDTLCRIKNSSVRFGCPDCTDGGGIYFEMKIGAEIKKFYIDTRTKKFSGELKKFAENLHSSILNMNGW